MEAIQVNAKNAIQINWQQVIWWMSKHKNVWIYALQVPTQIIINAESVQYNARNVLVKVLVKAVQVSIIYWIANA